MLDPASPVYSCLLTPASNSGLACSPQFPQQGPRCAGSPVSQVPALHPPTPRCPGQVLGVGSASPGAALTWLIQAGCLVELCALWKWFVVRKNEGLGWDLLFSD